MIWIMWIMSSLVWKGWERGWIMSYDLEFLIQQIRTLSSVVTFQNKNWKNPNFGFVVNMYAGSSLCSYYDSSLESAWPETIAGAMTYEALAIHCGFPPGEMTWMTLI